MIEVTFMDEAGYSREKTFETRHKARNEIIAWLDRRLAIGSQDDAQGGRLVIQVTDG